MINILNYQNFYLVGIKGVAMTSIAQCLLDAGKNVSGSDVPEEFVTHKILKQLKIKIDLSFAKELPPKTDCLIYTSAHQGPDNPQVIAAQQKKIVCLSQAEALASLFNQKKGIAVCGVGGKSTVSAMITWILSKNNYHPSYSVGVGEIIGLKQTGCWSKDSQYFVAEADEYVTDPQAKEKGLAITPRFIFLKPFVTVCTNLKFDHPDIYQNFNDTKNVYQKFFQNIEDGGCLIVNGDQDDLIKLSNNLINQRKIQVISIGEGKKSNFQLIKSAQKNGESIGEFIYQNPQKTKIDQRQIIKLKIPGKFNLLNALASIAACQYIGIEIKDSIQALTSFSSTARRFEYKGQKNGVKYYDDYAHHPSEIKATIQALNQWYPQQRKVIAFQSHTYSRTKTLLDDFIDAFQNAQEVLMIDIFASAREKFDPSIDSDLLCQLIEKKYPQIQAKNLKTVDNLAKFCQNELKAGDVFITIGAGDIYQLFKKIFK